MPPLTADDARWLAGEEAEAAISGLAGGAGSGSGAGGGVVSVAALARIRRTLPAERAAQVAEQAELRVRAATKFSRAFSMLFTRRGLEQSTDEAIARHKAARFAIAAAGRGPILDLCSGVGGDLIGHALVGSAARGLDRDPALAVVAAHNASAYGAAIEVQAGEASPGAMPEGCLWHADPDRRPADRRTTRPESCDPPLSALAMLRARSGDFGLKLAPASRLPIDWEESCELEWLSRGGECRQLVAWGGAVAFAPGERRATRLLGGPSGLGDGDASRSESLAGRPVEPPDPGPLAGFVCEPDPSVLAAGLAGLAASQWGARPVAAGVAYFSADRPVETSLAAWFAVEEAMPLDRRRLAAWLAQRRVGRLEVKVRGGGVDPARLRSELRLRGDQERTLLVYSPAGSRSPRVIVARRLAPLVAVSPPPAEDRPHATRFQP